MIESIYVIFILLTLLAVYWIFRNDRISLSSLQRRHISTFSNEYLLALLNDNEELDALTLSIVATELLRRMHKDKPLLETNKNA